VTLRVVHRLGHALALQMPSGGARARPATVTAQAVALRGTRRVARALALRPVAARLRIAARRRPAGEAAAV
jgi:hypothetical protein